MAYTPTEFDDKVNVSEERHIKEFFKLITILVIIIAVSYPVLIIITDKAISKISVETEQKLWKNFSSKFYKISNFPSPYQEDVRKIDSIIKELPESILPKGYDIKISVISNDLPNAFAFPGGNIVITSGLLKRSYSENALIFIIGHEIGHFINRDHLQGLGRAIISTVASLLFFGSDSSVLDFFSEFSFLIGNKYSQEQEIEADKWGLKTIISHYGHAGGSLEFLQDASSYDKTSDLLQHFSTHPNVKDRIDYLKGQIKNNNYKIRDVVVF